MIQYYKLVGGVPIGILLAVCLLLSSFVLVHTGAGGTSRRPLILAAVLQSMSRCLLEPSESVRLCFRSELPGELGEGINIGNKNAAQLRSFQIDCAVWPSVLSGMCCLLYERTTVPRSFQRYGTPTSYYHATLVLLQVCTVLLL